MHDDKHTPPEGSEGPHDEADRAIAELPDQLARARAVVRQAREQLTVHMNSAASDESA